MSDSAPAAGFPGVPIAPVSRSLLVDQVVDRLRSLVLSGEMEPGTRLIQEDVAARLQVSRTPLREAIRVLVHEGLLRAVPGRNSVEVAELDRRSARELYQVREVIDGLAARLCAETGLSDETIETLQKLVDEISEDPADESRFNVPHLNFHLEVISASGNQSLRQLLFIVQLTAQMARPRLGTSPERMSTSAKEHQTVLDAIKSRDPDAAEQAARGHIRAALDYWFGDEASAAH